MMFLMENWYLVVALMAVAGQGVAAVGGHAGRSGIRQRHRQAEAAADLRFIYPAISCIGYGGILRYLLPVGG